MTDQLRKAALDYHALPVPGKLAVTSTKPVTTQAELSLCYTPGVAEPVREIAQNPDAVYQYTSKGNLVAVITNGTAVLGLGAVGPLASKPVMEGKAVLFKALAGIDVFDIEIDCEDAAAIIETITHIAPTFGAINLEDIRAPECFVIENALKEKLSIPVFHDDQHGTAIVVAAGLLNALELQNKKINEVRIVCAGAGAAGIATMKLLKQLGAQQDHLLMVDRAGVIHTNRKDLNIHKKEFAVKTNRYTLAEAVEGADVFIGVSGPEILTPHMLLSMAERPIIFALSNPTPEIMPALAHATRQDLIMATGRSDYPNQVNNALCFPYIFRGALDVHAKCINNEMQLAAVHAIANLVHETVPDNIQQILSPHEKLQFSPDYLLPKMMDPRLREKVSSAVAFAAIHSGVALSRHSTA
ncbi:MAG: malic enzyme-like NAD(P)-binding protein [Gammaproteobacteria bacterium]|nr:malic enzyme-like NAD(P)-binding protein [Gammaproteobacteria bacterium]